MSKFDDLRQAYAQARKEFFTQRAASATFAETIVQGMETYIGSPQFQLHFLPYTQAVTSSKTHTATAAVWLANDALWHLKVAMELRGDAEGIHNETAGQTVTFEMVMQPVGTGFKVGIKGWNERFSLPATAGSPEHNAFYDFVCERIADSYRQPGHRFFDSMTDSLRVIGG
jgi:hypothetical protein